MLSRIAALFILTIAFGASAEAYEPKDIEVLLDQDVTYDSSIPKPEDVTGFQIGEIIYTPEMHHAYVRAVAAASDRVTVEEIGRSHFGRPILRVTTTSPANHARLDEIRATQLGQMQAGAGAPPADHPAIIQLTHGVHGSEASGYDSAAPLLYFLAAAQGPEIEALLDEVVINQVVLINPDGANRFAEWTNLHRARAPVADPQHREHFNEWPWGRTNHYWFDINRQWLPLTQPEAVALVSATHYWMPNIAVDLHEMGSETTYFFSPGPRAGLHPLLSQDAFDLNMEMNSFLTDQLDGEGALYVTEENFDDFYLGYGSSYPGLLGSVAYLFEQSSTRGILRETEYGTLRYDDKVGQQARVALSLIRAGQARRADLQSHMRAFFNESRRLASNSAVAGYVFTSQDRGRLADFLDIMAIHELDVRALSDDLRTGGRTYPAGESFYVPVNQNQYRLVQGIFETRIIENKSEFYDVSGWTQPLAWDLDYTPVRSGLFNAEPSASGEAGYDRAAPDPDRSPYVYVMEWDSYYAPRALYRLLNAGLIARVIPDETTVETTGGAVQPGRGAIVVPIAGQPLSADEIHAQMVRAAREDSVTVHAATTGLTASGSDLGGFSLSNIERPEVLLVTGRNIDSNGAGELWHMLDFQLEIPVSMIDDSELSRADLSRYTHILMPNGRYSELDDDFAKSLGDWVSEGGVLVGVRGGASWAMTHELSSAEWLEGPDTEGSAEPASYESLAAWDAEVDISGALFEAEIDITHPLAFGLRDTMLPVHKVGAAGFGPSDNPFALVARYADNDPILSGYASEANRERLEGAGVLHAERRGAGSVILFADNPVYRAYYRGSAKLVANALFFGNDFRNPSRRGPAQ